MILTTLLKTNHKWMRNWWGNSGDSLESAEPATTRRRAGGHKRKASPFVIGLGVVKIMS
jgi:hypothetical protein